MLTASMSPSIDPGDVTVVTPLAVSEVTEGMVITYHIPIGEQLVTHRVVSVEHGTDGSVTVQTKGDNNDAIDPWTATLEGDTAYQVRAVIPEIGHAIHALRTPAVATTLVYGARARRRLAAPGHLAPQEAGGGPSMTAIRRTALTLALSLTAVLGSPAPRPAQASFADSASRTTTIAAAVVDRPGQRQGPRLRPDLRDHGGDLEPQLLPPSPATS